MPLTKVSLPTELATKTCYLDFYIQNILALQEKYCKDGSTLPLAIMTSDDTHAKTEQLLLANDFFGMKKSDVTLMKQGKVAAISSNEGTIAQSPADPFVIEAKPHGHGDVHSLIHSHGVAEKWLGDGVEFVVFFQDTNGLGFLCLEATVGVSLDLGLVMNSVTIPRKGGQAVGAICKLTNSSTNQTRTQNVEYNQLDPLLRATKEFSDGDTDDATTGFSKFPGNINQLVISLKEYVVNLKDTKGVMAEFVNAKYADAQKTVFKKPTRLECMMQDYPMVLQGDDCARVGFTAFDAAVCFSPVKNAVADGVAAQKKGTAPAVAASGEADQYEATRRICRSFGCDIEEGEEESWQGIKIVSGPKIVVKPSAAPTVGDFKHLFCNGADVKISGRSSLVITGKNVVIKKLTLDGALEIRGDNVVVDGEIIENMGWKNVELTGGEDESFTMRGYKLEKAETCVIDSQGKSGDFVEVVEETRTDIEKDDDFIVSEVPTVEEKVEEKQEEVRLSKEVTKEVEPSKDDGVGMDAVKERKNSSAGAIGLGIAPEDEKCCIIS